MGLFSKIKKGVKKAFKGVKNVVSKVAKGVKKVAKKVAYAIPGGKQLWKLGTKVGQGITKGLKKVGKGIMKGIGKLGPVGIIAIQAVLSATGVGAGIAAAMGSMWSSMGAVAAASAQAGSVLGTVANAAFNAVNWVGGTVGAVGDAIMGGAKQLMGGNFSAAAETLGSNITKAFTGEAGMASVNAATQAASLSGAAMDAGVGMLDQAGRAFSGALAESGGTLAQLGTSFEDQAIEAATGKPAVANVLSDVPMQSAGPARFDPMSLNADYVAAGPQSAVGTFDVAKAAEANRSWLSKAGDALVDTGKEFMADSGKDLLKAGAKSLLSPGGGGGATTVPQYTSGYSPMAQGQAFAGPSQAQAITATQVGGYNRPYGY
jgi:hypothetical protein